MPSLIKPVATATIEGLYRTTEKDSFVTAPVQELEISEHGIVGDVRRNGSDPFSRVGVRLPAFPSSRFIIARREVSVIDTASAAMLGNALGMPENHDYGQLGPDRTAAVCRILGANILLRLVAQSPSLYEVPNATDFGPVDRNGLLADAALLITSYNNPCVRPFQKAMQLLPEIVDPSRQAAYLEAARSHRGVVATPSACGVFALGQEVQFFPRPVSAMMSNAPR